MAGRCRQYGLSVLWQSSGLFLSQHSRSEDYCSNNMLNTTLIVFFQKLNSQQLTADFLRAAMREIGLWESSSCATADE